MTNCWGKAGGLTPQPSKYAEKRGIVRPSVSVLLSGVTALISSTVLGWQPVLADDLIVGQPGGETHNVTGTENYDNFVVGDLTNDIGTVNILNGAVLNTGPGTSSTVGHQTGTSGTVAVSGNGSKWTASGNGDGVTFLGYSGSATLQISNGGMVDLSRAWTTMENGSSMTVTVSGDDSSLKVGDFLIGYKGTANVTVDNRGSLDTNGTAIGGWNYVADGTGSGSLTVTGTGTTWTERGGVDLARGGDTTADLTISDGATATVAGGVYGVTGATMLFTGNGTSVTIGDENDDESKSWVYFSGGEITVSDGVDFYSDGGYIGGGGPEATTMTVTGPGTTWDTTRRIYIGGDEGGGGGGNGSVTVSNGASVTSATIGVGMDTDSTGELILTGAGTTAHAYAVPSINYLGNVYVAYGGTAVVTVADGAALTVDNELRIATTSGGVGTLNIGAAAGDAAIGGGTITSPKIVFGEGDGTIVFNHTDSDYVLASDVTGTGTLKVLWGTTSLTGDYSKYTGDVLIEDGLLSIDTSSFVGGVFGMTGGTLAVNGSISGVADAVTMEGATLANAGSISGTQYGIVLAGSGNEVTNAGTISGGTASISYEAGGNRLNILPTAAFSGLVDFNSTTGNTTAFGSGSYSIPVAEYLTGSNTVELNNNRQSVIYTDPDTASGTIDVVDTTTSMASAFSTTQTITSTVGMVMTDIMSLDIDRNGPVHERAGSDGALGYAEEAAESDAEQAMAKVVGEGLAVAPGGNLVWLRGFGGQSFDDGTDTNASHYGVSFGIDHVVGQTRFGAMGGIGAMRNQTNDNSSKVTGNTAFGGLYLRHDAGGRYFDASLIAGGIFSTSEREINAGAETATGTYDGWFASPEIAVSGDYEVAPGWVLTPKSVLRYTYGSFDGYAEQGSSQNISYGNRSVEALQAAMELKITNRQQFANGQTASYSVTGTILDTYNMGDSALNASLQGTDFTISSAEQRNVFGGKIGVSSELKLNSQTTVFTGANASVYDNNSWDYAANAGVKVKF